MREIKFRAWLKGKCDNSSIDTPIRNPFMIYDVILNKKGWFSDVNADGSWYTYSNSPIMQYTGLKDENGIEIYDGDILFENFFDYIIIFTLSAYLVVYLYPCHLYNKSKVGN